MAELFGNYEIIRRIAAGGMAEVFLAKQSGLGGFERLVCIKRILPHLGDQPDFIRMFEDEARIAANLIHPNIAQIYDIGQFEGSYFIAMEYVRGEDMRRTYNAEVGRGQALPQDKAALIGMYAAAGLDYAHRQTTIDGRPLGIVHRDISPQNIIISYDGHVKIVDFGVAKAAGKVTETRSGVLKGKYSYMSPEQASGDPIDGRTDVFALGITLYEVTTGTRLFKRENELDTLHAVIEGKIKPPGRIIAAYSTDLEAIVMKALQYDPDDRYQTAAEMEQALERYLVAIHHPTSPSALATYMHDLFAEKLADELLFGGQLWEGTNTRAPATERISREKAPGETTRVEVPAAGSWSAVAPQDPWSDASRSGSGRPEWTLSGSISNTETQQDPQQAPLEPTVRAPDLRGPPAAAPAPPLPRVTWIMALCLLAGVLVAVAIPGQSEPPNIAALTVDSEPRGAAVTFTGPGSADLNERYRAVRTPFLLQGAPEGALARFTRDGFEPVDVTVPAVDATTPPLLVEFTAPRQVGALQVTSEPPGAAIWVDARNTGLRTPATVEVNGALNHALLLKKEGHADVSEERFVGFGESVAIHGELAPTAPSPVPSPRPAPKPTASLTIRSDVAMSVWVDKRSLGTTPIRAAEVEAGMRNLRFVSDEHGFTMERKVQLRAGGKTLTVNPARGRLSLNADPWAKVLIAGKELGTTPLSKEMYEGRYEVEFQCPDGKRVKKDVQVEGDGKVAATADCG
jgi:serine/threonine-protein kinase